MAKKFWRSTFKYDSSPSDPENSDTSDRLDTIDDCGDRKYEDWYRSVDERERNKWRTKKAFFKHYRRHSIQLINAFKEWGEHPKAFSSCEYRDGKLEEKPWAIKYRDIRFMQYMIIHVEKSHQELFEFITEIATDHNEICDKIQDIMTFSTPVRVDQPSFQKIIIDRIAFACRGLKAVEKGWTEEDNIYISDRIFRVIFNTVDSNASGIVLCEVPMNDKSRTRLWYKDTILLAQGDNTTIKNLKKTLEELALDTNIRKRVEKYNELYTKLMTDERIHRLQDYIDHLHESVHGMQPLPAYPGFPICDLCCPPKINL